MRRHCSICGDRSFPTSQARNQLSWCLLLQSAETNFSFLPLDITIWPSAMLSIIGKSRSNVLSVFAFKDCTEEGWWKHPISNRTWSNYTTCVNTEHLEVLLYGSTYSIVVTIKNLGINHTM